jgi:hypothetical protein
MPKVVGANHESGSVWREGVSPRDLPHGRTIMDFSCDPEQLPNHSGENHPDESAKSGTYPPNWLKQRGFFV